MRFSGQRSVGPGQFLPSHIWFAHGLIAGDVSGGTATVTVILLNTLNKFLASVEHISGTHGVAVAQNGILFLETRERYSSLAQGTMFFEQVIEMPAVAGGGAIASSKDCRNPFSGLIFAPETADPFVRLQVTNPGAGQNFNFEAWGYAWARGPRGTGVPIRP